MTLTVAEAFMIFTVVESIQMFLLVFFTYKSNQKLAMLLNEPDFAGRVLSNAIHGFIDMLLEDSKDGEKRRENFFGIMVIIGRNVLAGITGQNSQGGAPQPVKLKGSMRIFEPIVNNPAIQNMIANKIAEGLGNVGKKGIEKAGERIMDPYS